MRSEHDIQREIEMKMNTRNSRVFRNNVGSYKTDKGWIKFGLMQGSGDLIGWETVEITPEMVGSKIARFLSIEVKRENGRLSHEQEVWKNMVNGSGGRAIVAKKIEDC